MGSLETTSSNIDTEKLEGTLKGGVTTNEDEKTRLSFSNGLKKILRRALHCNDNSATCLHDLSSDSKHCNFTNAKDCWNKLRQLGPSLLFTIFAIIGISLNTFSAVAGLERFIAQNDEYETLMNIPFHQHSSSVNRSATTTNSADKGGSTGVRGVLSKLKRKSPVAAKPREKQTIPEPFKNGGIIYFHHLPMSGGLAIREFLYQQTIHFVARRVGHFKKMSKQIEQLIQMGELNGQIYAFETVGTVPAYTEISAMVREWKTASSAVQDVPFFAFTLLREPKALQISSFNHYYLDNRKRALANDTTQDFVQTLLQDAQCEFISRGGGFHGMLDGLIRNDRTLQELNSGLTDEECDRAYETLFEDMDWVGTTETLFSKTLPMLNYLTMNSEIPELDINEDSARMTQQRLDKHQMELLEKSTRRDRKWYQAAQVAFRFDDWNATIMSATHEHQ